MLAWIFPKYCSVTAKRSLKRVPFLGWFMALSGTVFIDRANSQSARGAMAGAAEEMREHRQSVYMFPEGTRSYYTEPGFLPFKKGAFHLAVQAKVPIVPVVVANYSDVLGLKTWTFRGGKIRVKGELPLLCLLYDFWRRRRCGRLIVDSVASDRHEYVDGCGCGGFGEGYEGEDVEGAYRYHGKGEGAEGPYAGCDCTR